MPILIGLSWVAKAVLWKTLRPDRGSVLRWCARAERCLAWSSKVAAALCHRSTVPIPGAALIGKQNRIAFALIINPKGNQPWILIGRMDAEAEASVLWPPEVKSQLAGKDWRQEKGITEDETVGWHYQLNGHEFEQTLGDGEGQGILTCCRPRAQESDTTEWLNNNF